MDTLHFKDYEEFACAVSNKYDEVTKEDELNSIGIVAKYEDAKEIIKELIWIGYDIKAIDISDGEFNGYEDEYVVYLMEDGIWCSPSKRDNNYLDIYADVCYVLSNCNSKIINKIEANEVHEIGIGEDFECDGDCEHCDHYDFYHGDDSHLTLDKEDDGVHGFTFSKSDDDGYSSYSFYSSELMTHDLLKEFTKILDKM